MRNKLSSPGGNEDATAAKNVTELAQNAELDDKGDNRSSLSHRLEPKIGIDSRNTGKFKNWS